MSRRLHFRYLSYLTALLIVPFCLAPAAEPPKSALSTKGPLTPPEGVREFRLAPGLRIELVAAEPQVESPVAMAFDEDGKLWVVEMRDYPNGPAAGQPPAGRIRVLEDRDGDGRFEHSTVFADQLLFANGLLPWKGGAIVTAAPHIVLLRDTDGDGKADRREVLYEGFATQNPQLRVSYPVLGLDNWVYVANGLRGGQVIRAGQKDAKPVNLSGMDFRFDLLRDRHEAISGMGQFGNTFDDWGQRFVCDNRHHLRHIVIENRYLKRNPVLAAPAVVEDISELEDGPLSSGGKIYPLSKNWTTSSLHVGRFTAACGVFFYRSSLLPENCRSAAFTCDPTGNLVHQEILQPRGATFRSRPAQDKAEFLATPDEWCRPVALAEGPDEALYVVDMYRAVIEHPEFMPAELKNRPDLTLGKERGRIWRVVPEKRRDNIPTPRLGKASIAELVRLLEHPGAWWRTTAQRLLLERQDRAAVEPLRELLAASKSPQAQLHAAWLLDNLGGLDDERLLTLMRDPHPRVRENAVRLAEGRLTKSSPILERVLELAEDADARLRFQAALTLGEGDDPRTLPALGKIALRGSGDRWTRLAVLSSVPQRAGELLTILLNDPQGITRQVTPDRLQFLQELTTLIGSRREPADIARTCEALLALTGKEGLHWQLTGLTGLAEGMGRRGTQLGTFLKALPRSEERTAERTNALLAQTADLAGDARRDPAERLAALRLLAHASWETVRPTLTRMLAEEANQELRLAALRALAAHAQPEVAELLLKSWSNYTPALRREAAEAMMRQPDRMLYFLKQVEAGKVKPGDLDAVRTRQLVNHSRTDIRDLARKHLQANLPAERKEVLERYQAALKLKGDPKRGQAIFQKNCATCHKVAGVGVDVGPDIADTRTKTPDMLLLDILNPNQAIDSNYISYLVTLKNGRSLTGVIATETASGITLRRAENQADVLLRQDIEEIQSTGVSLMPEGLEKTIGVEEMADLIDFLKNWRYLDGTVPLGQDPQPKRYP